MSEVNDEVQELEQKNKKSRYRPILIARIGLYILEVAQILLGALFLYYFDELHMWPQNYIIIIGIIMFVILLVVLVIKRWKWGCLISFLLSVAMIFIQVQGCYYVFVTKQTLDKVTQNVNTETNVICVLVLDIDPAKDINDARDYTFGILTEVDREHTDATVKKINGQLNKSIETKEFDNVLSLASSLYSGEADAIIINNSFVDLISEYDNYTDFENNIRSIFVNVISTKVPSKPQETTTVIEEKPFDITEDTFNVYISGIDTEGYVTTKSRSDVNVIMSINPTTKQILLLSTPRDYYVPLSISNGVKDKLTHAGLYGVDVSMETLEMLYDIDISYFVRMNFTGFRDIIDTLGGVDVYSDYSFSAKGFNFNSGYNKLYGEAALVFARERKSFASGDNQRGKNQMAVITAVIEKVQSSSLLSNYTEILNSISDCMQTNMSQEEIAKLVKFQLGLNEDWNIVSYSVTGSGQSQYTYSIPGARAYVMEPNMDTVNEAKKMLNRIKNGKKIKIPQ